MNDKDSNDSCLEGVTVTLKEALQSTCPEKHTNKRVLFASTKYKITDILGKVFQAGFVSCYLSIKIHRPSNFDGHCQIILHRKAHKCLYQGYLTSNSIPGIRTDKNIFVRKCFDHKECAELELTYKIYM